MTSIKRIFLIAIGIWVNVYTHCANDSIFVSEPRLILEGNAGENPGEFGMDITFAVSDFIVDIYNDIWIMDWLNRRVQKFNEAGKYLNSFPNENIDYPVKPGCKHIETDLKGNIYMGPLSGALILINHNGQYLKNIDLPIREGVIFDFAVTGKGEILIPKNDSEVALDGQGTILYAVNDVNFIRGANTSPYSPHLFHFNHVRSDWYTIYPGGLKNAIENNTKHQINADIFKYDSKFISSHRILLIDEHHNYFVALSAGKTIFQTQQIGYYSKDGKKLAILEMPRMNIKTRFYGMPFALDKDGNFYLMQIFLPEDVNTDGPPRPFNSGQPCLYLWKWERVE